MSYIYLPSPVSSWCLLWWCLLWSLIIITIQTRLMFPGFWLWPFESGTPSNLVLIQHCSILQKGENRMNVSEAKRELNSNYWFMILFLDFPVQSFGDLLQLDSIGLTKVTSLNFSNLQRLLSTTDGKKMDWYLLSHLAKRSAKTKIDTP